MPDAFGPKRDRWGRYLLPDPNTGKERAWTRATTLSSTLADTYGLTRWQMRMVAKGLGMRRDLLALAAAAHVDDKVTLDRVADDAKEAAGSSAGANQGTALHSFTEAVDRGEEVSPPPPWDADVAAYRDTLAAHRVQTHREWVERIVVCPEFGVAGTFDRIVTLDGGRRVIGDVKTGKDLSYSWPEISVQLALYANATHMWTGDDWEKMPVVDPNEAVVFWLPVGKANCELFTVNTVVGWEMAAVAYQVRQFRGLKNLATAWPSRTQPALPAVCQLPDCGCDGTPHSGGPLTKRSATEAFRIDEVRKRISRAATVDELVQIWTKASTAGTWTPELTAAAADRKRALTTVGASNPTEGVAQ